MDFTLTEFEGELLDLGRTYAEREIAPAAARAWHEERCPTELLRGLGELGLLGPLVPEKWGGIGSSTVGYVALLGALATVDPSVAAAWQAHSTIGSLPLLLFADDEQRERWLRPLAELHRRAGHQGLHARPEAARRFWFMWDELAFGVLDAVVLADTRRVAGCFASIDYFERNGTPFVIAVNCFDGAPRFSPEDIRIALSLGPEVPVLLHDARQRESVKQALVNLVKHVMAATDPALSGGLSAQWHLSS